MINTIITENYEEVLKYYSLINLVLAISVLDVYEAINSINASSNLYSASIFTSDYL